MHSGSQRFLLSFLFFSSYSASLCWLRNLLLIVTEKLPGSLFCLTQQEEQFSPRQFQWRVLNSSDSVWCGCHYMPISKLISGPTNCYALMFRQVSTQLGSEKWRHPNHMDWEWGRISSSSLEENWGALPRRRWNRYSKNNDYRNQEKSVKESGSQQCHMTQRLKKMGRKWAQCTLDSWLSHLLF